MKKVLLLINILLASVMTYAADPCLYVDGPLVIKPGETLTVPVKMYNEADCGGFSIDAISLPAGLSFVSNALTTTDRVPTGFTVSASLNETGLRVAGLGLGVKIAAGDGEVFAFQVRADESADLGTGQVTFSVVKISAGGNFTSEGFNDNVTVCSTDMEIVILDETATTAPAPASGVCAAVRRPIKGGVWSTLVLPFGMSAEQVEEAFGDEVLLADFTGWEATERNADNSAKTINVSFTSTDHIVAHKPVIIRVQEAIDGFAVAGVDITTNDSPAVTVGTEGTGDYGTFTGTYTPIMVPADHVFLSNNKFFYSASLSPMNGYRAYFWFEESLPNGGNNRMTMELDGESTAVDNIIVVQHGGSEAVYTLGGLRVNADKQLKRGLYIKGGKKIVIN